MMNKIFINLSRLLFAVLIIFETLNQLKILKYTLTFTWLGLIITSGLIWLFLEFISLYMRKKCGRQISGLAMLAAAAVVYFDALGDIFLFYAKYGWYDQTAHLIGGAAAGGIVFSLISSLVACNRVKMGVFGIAFFSWMSAGFFGMLYELEEYFEDFFTGSRRLGDGFDTANDLFLNISGALIIIILSAFYVYYRNRSAN